MWEQKHMTSTKIHKNIKTLKIMLGLFVTPLY